MYSYLRCHSLWISLFLLSGASAIANGDNCEAIRNDAIEIGTQHSFDLSSCPLERLAVLVAERYLATDADAIEFRLLAGTDSHVQAKFRAVDALLEKVTLTPDSKMLRIDWQLTDGESTSQRRVAWLTLKRTGWHWIAQRQLSPGERIREVDVHRVYGEIAPEKRISWESWPDDLEVTATIGAGSVLVAHNVSNIPDLLAGDRAVLQIQSGAITMQLAGDLQQAAYLNKTTRIKLRHNGAIVYGRLQADNIIVPCAGSVSHGRNSCVE